MKEFVQEDDLDYFLILERGFGTQGDEDFAVFNCPECKRIYLLEYEGDILFSDPHDPTLAQAIDSSFSCLFCANTFSTDEPIIGPKANDRFRVRKEELLASPWSWLLLSPERSHDR